ncbi:MAG: hypothetical protein JSS55_12780 [Proteobacteria bacterium]|nr:hypothetical protein [Pseudomonadota bacterium]
MKMLLTVAALAAATPLFAQTTPAADPHAGHAGHMDCCKEKKDCCKDADGKAKRDCCEDGDKAAADGGKADAHASHAPK